MKKALCIAISLLLIASSFVWPLTTSNVLAADVDVEIGDDFSRAILFKILKRGF